ncbi:MAG: DegT/DnrJ/EryC1/StrS family aminotransferase [Candidatus Omnitrophota bacterium]
MKIPFTDLNLLHRKIRKELLSSTEKVLRRSDFILGEEVRLFEAEFAKFCGCRFSVGLNSGTDALFFALKALGIGPGDEVIVPAFTYIATAFAVTYTGAKPVFVDIEEHTYNINAAKIERAITKRTKAIIPVHLYGQPVNMPQIIKIAKAYGLKVIEDAAQAHAATVELPGGKRKKTGAIGDIGCFSFYPTKNLGALGDGGAITTNNEDIYRKIIRLRDYGRVSRYEHASVGYNSRLDTLQAGMLRVKLRKLENWTALRRKAAACYNRLLERTNGLITPFEADGVKHVYHVYALRIMERDVLADYLQKKGISVLIHYPKPLHLQDAYKNLGYKMGDFPCAEKISLEIISLPIYPFMNNQQIKFVADAIKNFLKEQWKKRSPYR